MAATPEAKVKANVRKLLDELGIYHFMPPANGFGRAGIPPQAVMKQLRHLLMV